MTLHMIRLRCDLPALYQRIAEEHRDADVDYALHAHLRATFGDAAPQPFRVTDERHREAIVLGYSASDAETLRRDAVTLGWSDLTSKPMPVIASGRRLRFEVRVCPVRRGRQTGPHPKRNRGTREVDAFIAETWAVGPETRVDREAVYVAWLRERLERAGAAALSDVRLERFRRVRVLRRTQGVKRKGRLCERPDAVLSGVLEVGDAENFHALLGRGIGRHRAFGFGMLLLRAT